MSGSSKGFPVYNLWLTATDVWTITIAYDNNDVIQLSVPRDINIPVQVVYKNTYKYGITMASSVYAEYGIIYICLQDGSVIK